MTAKNRSMRTDRPHIGGETQRLLRERWVISQNAQVWEPPTDVYENEHGLVVRVEIAGMCENDFSIRMEERLLIVEGTRHDAEIKRTYHQLEIRYGAFRTEVHLPWLVDPEQVEATYESGFLQILLPRPSAHRVPVVEQRRCEG